METAQPILTQQLVTHTNGVCFSAQTDGIQPLKRPPP